MSKSILPGDKKKPSKPLARRRGRPVSKIAKHQRARDEIQLMIRNEKLAPGHRLPTEAEYARQLKVSHQTIRRALDDLARDGLIVRVRGSGSYVADRNAKPLIPGRTLRLALLWPIDSELENLEGTYLSDMTKGVLRELGMAGTAPQSMSTGPRSASKIVWQNSVLGLTVVCLGTARHTRVRQPSFRCVVDGKFDGIISLSVIEEDWIEKVLDLGVPTVLTDYPNEKFFSRVDQVHVDPLQGFRQVIAQYKREGLTRIHFIGKIAYQPAPDEKMSPQEFAIYREGKERIDPDSIVREMAFRQAMGELDLPVSSDHIHLCQLGHGEPERCAEALAQRPEERRPEAVVCYAASVAEAFIDTFHAKRLALKGVGCTGEKGWSGKAHAVKLDLCEMGAAAAALLTSRLQRPSRPFFRVAVGLSSSNIKNIDHPAPLHPAQSEEAS